MRTAETRKAVLAVPAQGVAGGASSWALAVTAGFALVLTGCPVDDRDLITGDGGAAGRGQGGQGGRSGAGAVAGDGGVAQGGSGAVGAVGAAGDEAMAGVRGDENSGGSGTAGETTAGRAGSGSGGTTCPPVPTGGRGGAGGGGPASCTCGGNGTVVWSACPDLDGNQVPDCDETAIRNATFDADTRFWTEEMGLTLSWSDSDAHARDDSGSIVIENTYEDDLEGQFMTGVRQCIDVSEAAVYRVAAEILVPEGQDEGSGGIQLLIYDEVGCSGRVVMSGIANAVAARDEWKVITVTRASPASAKSVALRLIAVKPYSQDSFKVLFDNVLVRVE